MLQLFLSVSIDTPNEVIYNGKQQDIAYLQSIIEVTNYEQKCLLLLGKPQRCPCR